MEPGREIERRNYSVYCISSCSRAPFNSAFVPNFQILMHPLAFTPLSPTFEFFVDSEGRMRQERSSMESIRSPFHRIFSFLSRWKASCEVDEDERVERRKDTARRIARCDAMYASNERTITPRPAARAEDEDGPWAPCEIIITLHDPRHNAV